MVINYKTTGTSKLKLLVTDNIGFSSIVSGPSLTDHREVIHAW